VDNDPLAYVLSLSFTLNQREQTLTYRSGPDTTFLISRIDSLLYGAGLVRNEQDQTVNVTWWVSVTDGKQVNASSVRSLDVLIPRLPEGVNDGQTVAIDYALTALYPNPFNAVVSMGYTVPTAGMVSIAIFDINGKKVAEPVNSWVGVGSHTAVWSGIGHPSGIYLVRMSAGEFTAFRKVQMIK
jgi:acyl-CoA hydrolase